MTMTDQDLAIFDLAKTSERVRASRAHVDNNKTHRDSASKAVDAFEAAISSRPTEAELVEYNALHKALEQWETNVSIAYRTLKQTEADVRAMLKDTLR